MHNLPKDASLSVAEMAKLSGFPIKALKEVEKRGYGAYTTNPLSVRMKGTYEKNVDAPMSQKLTPQEWAFGRLYAFLMKTKKVFYGSDKDIAEKYNLL
jgi:hypothetical protein